MAYGRHTFINRGGATGSIIAPSRSLADYRNKIAAILGITVLYTAFLYHSGSLSSSSSSSENRMRFLLSIHPGLASYPSQESYLLFACWVSHISFPFLPFRCSCSILSSAFTLA